MPRQILYSDSNFIRGCALFGNTFVLIPAFMYLAFSQLKSKNWMMLVILSIPMNGMGAAIYINKVEVNDLERYGHQAVGVVVAARSVDRKRVTYDWEIMVRYDVQDEARTTAWEGDNRGKYQVGDSIEIVYLPEFPKVYRLMMSD